ncbi:MAG: MFS transporter [Pseudomonadota bacterium]
MICCTPSPLISEFTILTAFRQYFSDKLNNDTLLRQAAFRRYWFSGILNDFGNYIGALALPLCSVLLLHATPAQMGMLVAAQAIPFALFALPAGVWLDRHRKLPILLFSQTVLGLSLASIPLAYWLDILSIAWIAVVSFMLGVCSVVGGGAEQVFLTFLVGRANLTEAQSRFASTDSVARLVAPGLAGVLIQALTAPVAMLVNAVSYFISVWNLRQLGVIDPQPAASDKHPLRDIREGFAFIWSQPLLRALAWGAGAWHLLFSGYNTLAILFATRELGMSPGMLGAAQTLGGIGVFASSVLVKPLSRRYGAGVTVQAGIAATALSFVLLPCIPRDLFGSAHASAAAFVALSFFFDCGVMLFLIAYASLRVSVTPDAFMGRMISTMRFLTVAMAPLGALAAGYMGGHFSIRTGLACVGAGGVGLTIAMLLSKPVRGVRPVSAS